MKLISVYIENFGCLHQYGVKFDDGLTVIREDNGFGKTTLAEFIRAMFYGFPRGARTLDKNRRKKYLPWNGCKCGGHLIFELDGAAYRIERTFSATPKGDTFRLIDLSTNQKSTRFTENVGIELFELDGESFERSTYMPQFREAGTLTTDSIRAKLGNLVEDTNDINNFDKAAAALKNRRSAYIPYRGNGGSVAEARSMVSRLQQELDHIEAKRESLDTLQTEEQVLERELQRDNRELAAVRERITRASQASAAATVRQQYESLLSRRDSAASAAADSRFADGIPGADAFEEAHRDCEQYLSVTAQLRGAGLSAAEKAQLEELDLFFASGVPDEGMLEDWSRQYQQMLRLQSVAESQRLSAEEQERLCELTDRFDASAPSRKQIDEARVKLERAEQLRLASAADTAAGKKSGRAVIALLAAGVLGLVAGTALLAGGGFVPGGILLGVGVPVLIAAAYLGIRQMISRELAGGPADVRKRIRADGAEASRLEWEVECFVRQYSNAASLAEGLDEIREQQAAYQALVQRKAELEESSSRANAEFRRCADGLRAALEPYFGADCDCERAILTLRMKRSRMLDLREKQACAEEACAALRLRRDTLRERLCGFLAPYYNNDIAPERFHSLLTQLRRDCDEFVRAEERLDCLEKELAAFRAEHEAVLEISVEAFPNPEILKQQERRLSERIMEQTRRQLECRQWGRLLWEEIDRIPELRDSLERWQARKNAHQKNADTLDRTLEYLQQARENLSGNYLGKIQRSFAEYLGVMTGEEREKILVTGDLEVQLERQGQARELGYFSAGQTDLVMLCMRFALVDALFTGVKPFVILDDPFVNLDDVRTEQALALLKDLARDRQIVYLTCNSSRA